MGKIILDESQLGHVANDDLASVRAYASAASKCAAVAKEDYLLAARDIVEKPKRGADALYAELKFLLGCNYFKILDVPQAETCNIKMRVHMGGRRA